MTTVKIILASTRPGSSGPAIGAWVADRAGNVGAFDRVEVLDLAQVNLPFLDEPEHPRLGRYTIRTRLPGHRRSTRRTR